MELLNERDHRLTLLRVDPERIFGQFKVVADGAFSLLRLEQMEITDDGMYLRVSEPPDFSVEGEKTSFHFYPIRTIEGRPRFRIDSCATWGTRG